MGALDTIRGRFDHGRGSQPFVPPEFDAQHASKENPSTTPAEVPSDSSSLEMADEKEIQNNPNQINEQAQAGVQKAEAAALVYTKKVIIGIILWIWVCYFMLAFHQAILSNMSQYVFADFKNAPQVTTSYITSDVVAGVMRLPLAKTLNLWGRAEGLIISLVIYLIGIIILAACNGASAYAAGYTLYFIGYDCIYLILEIFIVDTTGLRNRAWAFAFSTTPFICTAFTAPLAVTSFLNGAGWRWSFGVFAIVQPFVFLPLAGVFKYYEQKAKKLNVYKKESSGRSVLKSIVHYIHEFDLIGALILLAAFILFLLPFGLASWGRSEYSSAKFIAMVVIGIVLFPVFAIWEKFFARTHFIRYQVFKNRSVTGACFLAAVLNFNFVLWDTWLQNYILCIYNIGQTFTGYTMQTYNVGSTFWSVIVGIWIYKTKHFKYLVLFFGLPLMVLGSGLMIHFRGSVHGIGYLIMCQIFIAFAGGTCVIGEDMAIMAGADRDGIPMALALLNLFFSVGGAIGRAVISSIYSNTFFSTLQNNLPADMKSNATDIFLGGISTQLSYQPGSPTREAINSAYSMVQRQGCIASTAILVLGFPAIMMWKNYNVDKKQVKGTVI
ncbi:siderochrome-iron transporter [Penicillium capsulatum]|uniref:Siderochrome-iron transporter n=1 Tax=Penicillium capsulatum TaxID=69766 RepID=A0A9W9HWN7_9EURO|nr:siderochrome-iron transporter [Penicillium capsulatum]KAJ6106578.1 siderochrome-iron transporter [Penicillium capsulatum]